MNLIPFYNASVFLRLIDPKEKTSCHVKAVLLKREREKLLYKFFFNYRQKSKHPHAI